MRVLVVGFAASVHVARYLQLFRETGWDFHLFESRLHTDPHPELSAVTLHPASPCDAPPGSGVTATDPPPGASSGFRGRVDHLAGVIDSLRPDVVHSHEIQHAGALVDGVRRSRGDLEAPWLVTNWGSDIFWFGRDRTRVPRIRSVLAGCDYYGAECHRDVALARAFGLRGKVVGVWPVTGGIDVAHAASLRADGPTSARRAIAVKGAVSFASRGDVLLAAVERCADLLAGWEVCGHQMDPDLDDRFDRLAATTDVDYTRLSLQDARDRPHDDMLAMLGRSRVSLGLNRTDALSTSFLEAMAMGAFPVQGDGSCGYEITPAGRGALFVPATDVDAVTAALRRALTDDALVDRGAALNARAVAEHLDRRRTRARAMDAYERMVADAVLEAA